MICLTTVRPRPVPSPCLVVNIGSKIKSSCSSRIPSPLSATSIWTRAPSRRVRTCNWPPSGMASRLLLMRLMKTCCNWSPSATTPGRSSPSSVINTTLRATSVGCVASRMRVSKAFRSMSSNCGRLADAAFEGALFEAQLFGHLPYASEHAVEARSEQADLVGRLRRDFGSEVAGLSFRHRQQQAIDWLVDDMAEKKVSHQGDSD